MSIFDQYQKGSLSGEPFLYVGSDGDFGRRNVVHQYPGRDLPFNEDMGRRARSWPMEIMVAGTDYMAWRNRLISVLEAPGEKTLVHPTLGEMKVVVLDARGPRESTRRGGTATFYVVFGEAGENRYPSDNADRQRVVNDRGDTTEDVLASDFAINLDVDGRPSFIPADAIARISDFADNIRTTITGLPDLVGATDLMQAVNDLSDAASTLIRTPIDLGKSLNDIWDGIVDAVTQPLDAFNALKSYFSYTGFGTGTVSTAAATIPLTTSNREIQDSNRTVLLDTIIAGATITCARLASAAEYDSQDDADAQRRIITDQIDVVCLTASDELYAALMDLRAAVIDDLGNRPGLPTIRRITLPADTPALVLAHRLYGDATRDNDIVSRNSITHPGFVTAGHELEVLSA